MSECDCSAQYNWRIFNDLSNRGPRHGNLVFKPTGATSAPLLATETSIGRVTRVMIPWSPHPYGMLKIGDLSNLSHPLQNGQKDTP